MAKKDKIAKAIRKLEIRQHLKATELPKNAYEAQGKLPQTGMLVVRDLVLGGFAGGLIGSALGRYSLLAGVAVAGAAYYFGKPGLAGIGVGMAAAGMFSEKKSLDGSEEKQGFSEKLNEAKDRMKSFAEGFRKKLFIDKLVPQKQEEKQKVPPKEPEPKIVEDEQTQSFQGLGTSEDPLAELEQQLVAEAMNFQQENGVQATEQEEVSGHENEDFEDSESEWDNDEEWEDEESEAWMGNTPAQEEYDDPPQSEYDDHDPEIDELFRDDELLEPGLDILPSD